MGCDMMHSKIVKELFDFIDRSPNSFFAAQNLAEELEGAGYERLFENESWNLEAGRGYYVLRNNSALIAFRMTGGREASFQLVASHGDSPSFKIKTSPEIEACGEYVKLNVEKYGGMLMSSWFDRPLSFAGRLIVKKDGGIESRFVNIKKDVCIIPNLAIHFNREANDGYKYNAQKDMLPLYSMKDSKKSIKALAAEAAGVKEEEVLEYDLFLYNRDCGRIVGVSDEFISSPRLDDLECAFTTFRGFLDSGNCKAECTNIPVFCLFDNEEVGSETRQGAGAGFLADVLKRINLSLGGNEEDYIRRIAGSFMLSADNAHSVHPNYADKSDPSNNVLMNKGIVIKYNANQKYATDALSASVFIGILDRAGIPHQSFVNRSDVAGGSTLGNISGTQAAINTVDIGLAQLAMHSALETAGAEDPEYMYRGVREFYSSRILRAGDRGYYI